MGGKVEVVSARAQPGEEPKPVVPPREVQIGGEGEYCSVESSEGSRSRSAAGYHIQSVSHSRHSYSITISKVFNSHEHEDEAKGSDSQRFPSGGSRICYGGPFVHAAMITPDKSQLCRPNALSPIVANYENFENNSFFLSPEKYCRQLPQFKNIHGQGSSPVAFEHKM